MQKGKKVSINEEVEIIHGMYSNNYLKHNFNHNFNNTCNTFNNTFNNKLDIVQRVPIDNKHAEKHHEHNHSQEMKQKNNNKNAFYFIRSLFTNTSSKIGVIP